MKGQEPGCMPVRRICLSRGENVLVTQWKLGSGSIFFLWEHTSFMFICVLYLFILAWAAISVCPLPCLLLKHQVLQVCGASLSWVMSSMQNCLLYVSLKSGWVLTQGHPLDPRASGLLPVCSLVYSLSLGYNGICMPSLRWLAMTLSM